MSELKETLKQLECLLQGFNYPILNCLQVGKENAESEILELFTNLKLPIRSDIVEMYKWKNGVKELYKTNIARLELFPNGIMLSLEYAISRYILEAKTNKIFTKEYFPLFTSGGGDYILINMDNTKSTFGQIFLFSPSVLLTNMPISIYDSLTSLFKTVLEIYRQKGYYFDNNNLEVKYDTEKEISKKLNTKSEFWIED